MKKCFESILLIGALSLLASCEKDKVKIEPYISWQTPQPLISGLALTEQQLNASSTAPGAFTYTPPLGTKLAAGTHQQLRVDFTPDEAEKYNKASATVFITVVTPHPIVGTSEAVFPSDITYGQVIDLDSNVYRTVTIGTQTWMAENLRTSKYSNGDDIAKITDSFGWTGATAGAYCHYNSIDDRDFLVTYGRLYNRFAINDTRSIAPAGWRIPTEADWDTLASYVGDNNTAGRMLKEAGTSHWLNNGINETNAYGFTALPSGCRNNGEYSAFGNVGYWWNSSVNKTFDGRAAENGDTALIMFANGGIDTDGFSIRCIKVN